MYVPALGRKIEIDFTDEQLTGCAGMVFVAQIAKRIGLEQLLGEIRLKQRNRGATDAETLLSLVYCLAQGNGALRDVDRLAVDAAQLSLLGLEHTPASRRVSEYLAKFSEGSLEKLQDAARAVAQHVAGVVVQHHLQQDGFVPLFLDGSAIEVSGQYFEGASKGYNGEVQYWLHSVFLGGLWVGQRLQKGGQSVILDWQSLLERDVIPLVPPGTPVWLRMDNAYYNRDIVRFCQQHQWDYSISVTSGTYKKPLKKLADKLDESAWVELGMGEQAALIKHKPGRWKRHSYVVIRKRFDGKQKLLVPIYTFIVVSRSDLPIAELVKRHRGKQGQENVIKGPLQHMDLHDPPCRAMKANAAFYTLGQIAQMLLLAVQYKFLPKTARQYGLRTLLRDIIRIPARLVRHARKLIVKFAKSAFRLEWIAHAADATEAMALS